MYAIYYENIWHTCVCVDGDDMQSHFDQGYADFKAGSESRFYESSGSYYRRLPKGGVAIEDDRVQAQEYIDGFCQAESDSHD